MARHLVTNIRSIVSCETRRAKRKNRYRDWGPRSSSTEGERTTRQTELKRAIAPRVLLLLVLGDIPGTGIHALVGELRRYLHGSVCCHGLGVDLSGDRSTSIRWRLSLGVHHSALIAVAIGFIVVLTHQLSRHLRIEQGQRRLHVDRGGRTHCLRAGWSAALLGGDGEPSRALEFKGGI
jgi:hypothetical protein